MAKNVQPVAGDWWLYVLAAASETSLSPGNNSISQLAREFELSQISVKRIPARTTIRPQDTAVLESLCHLRIWSSTTKAVGPKKVYCSGKIVADKKRENC